MDESSLRTNITEEQARQLAGGESELQALRASLGAVSTRTTRIPDPPKLEYAPSDSSHRQVQGRLNRSTLATLCGGMVKLRFALGQYWLEAVSAGHQDRVHELLRRLEQGDRGLKSFE